MTPRDLAVHHDRGIPNERFPVAVIHPRGLAQKMEWLHWHDAMEISHIDSGRGCYEIEDKVFDVKPGDIIVVNDVERHRVYYDDADPLYETSIHIDPTVLYPEPSNDIDSQYLRLFGYSPCRFVNKVTLTSSERDEVSHLVGEIIDEAARRSVGYELMTKSLLLTLVATVMRACLEHGNMQNDDAGCGRPSDTERLARIVSFIRKNYRHNIDLGSVSQEFGMSKAYFSDHFHRNLGITFSAYLRLQRLKHAVRLLDEGIHDAEEVASICGFNSRTSLYRALRRRPDIRSIEPKA